MSLLLLAACAPSPELPPAPFACPAGTEPRSEAARFDPADRTWSCVDGEGRLAGRWERRWGDTVVEEGAFAAGRRDGEWRVERGYASDGRVRAWRAEGAFADGVPTGNWSLAWQVTAPSEGPRPDRTWGGPIEADDDRWFGPFADGAPVTVRTMELAEALATRDALPKELVTLRIPVSTVGRSTIAPETRVCHEDGEVFSLGKEAPIGEEAPILVDPFPLFAVGFRGSIGGPDSDFSRVLVDWKDAEPTGTIEAVTLFGADSVDRAHLRACFLEPAPVARILAWRVCGATSCGPWTGFWDAAFSDATEQAAVASGP